jgi:hypothetical protein
LRAELVTATRAIDKRTGKLLYDKQDESGGQQFYAVNTDPKAGTIELVGYNRKIQFYVDARRVRPKPDKPRKK